MVRHTAETYREAALEHMKLAQTLHSDLGEYGPAHYWAGVAVECMLRAWRMLVDPQFESRHDLHGLVKEAGLLDLVPAKRKGEVAGALGEVARRWSNDHRYRPSRLVGRWLRDKRLDEQVSGDRLKFSSHRIVASAQTVVQIAEQQWQKRHGSSPDSENSDGV